MLFFLPESQLPPHLYLSDSWKKPRRGSNVQKPIEEFSPSQIEKFEGGCQLAWGLRYLLGYSEHFQNVAAKNGEDLHNQVHGVYDGKPLPLADPDKHKAWIASRALPGLIFLPRFDQCLEVHRERQEWIDTTQAAPQIEALRIQVKKDLEIKTHEGWLIYDHKSVKKWQYQKDADDLQGDTQAISYAIDTMQRRVTSVVPGRWVYYLMDPEKEPEARKTDVVFNWVEIAPRASRIFQTADYMRQRMRAFVHGDEKKRLQVLQNELQPSTFQCFKYYSAETGKGACPYSQFMKGPCPHGASPPDRKKGKSMTQVAPVQNQPFPFALPGTAQPTVAAPPATTGVSVPSHYASAGGVLPLNLPPLPFAPPEAFQPPPGSPTIAEVVHAVSLPQPTATALPPLPPGWTYTLDGRPVPVPPSDTTAFPPLQPGYVRGLNGEAIFVGQNAASQPAPAPAVETSKEEEKPKRKRRTKEEIEADKAAKEGAKVAPAPAVRATEIVESVEQAPQPQASAIVIVLIIEGGEITAKRVDDEAAARQLKAYVG